MTFTPPAQRAEELRSEVWPEQTSGAGTPVRRTLGTRWEAGDPTWGPRRTTKEPPTPVHRAARSAVRRRTSGRPAARRAAALPRNPTPGIAQPDEGRLAD